MFPTREQGLPLRFYILDIPLGAFTASKLIDANRHLRARLREPRLAQRLSLWSSNASVHLVGYSQAASDAFEPLFS
jgi:hypothetical protein